MDPGVKQVVFYSDGDPQYARLARKYFPTATIVVDFYHVSEYLWKAGETLYKEGSKELIGFVEQLKEMVCNDEVEEVLSIPHPFLPGPTPRRCPASFSRGLPPLSHPEKVRLRDGDGARSAAIPLGYLDQLLEGRPSPARSRAGAGLGVQRAARDLVRLGL